MPPDDIASEAAGIPPSALACLIYTSGTGGSPRGVMLPHRCILSNCAGAFDLVRPLRLSNEIYLSYLPVSHAYEHTVGQFFLLSLGTEIVYARGVEHLAADMLAVRPTILTAVPRVLEVIRVRVLTQVARETPFRQRLFRLAISDRPQKGGRASLDLVGNTARSNPGSPGAGQGAGPLRRPTRRRDVRWRPPGTRGRALLPRARA